MTAEEIPFWFFIAALLVTNWAAYRCGYLSGVKAYSSKLDQLIQELKTWKCEKQETETENQVGRWQEKGEK